MLIGLLLVEAWTIYNFIAAARIEDDVALVVWIGIATITGVLAIGFFTVNPNEGRVLQLFGHYVGTARIAGLR